MRRLLERGMPLGMRGSNTKPGPDQGHSWVGMLYLTGSSFQKSTKHHYIFKFFLKFLPHPFQGLF